MENLERKINITDIHQTFWNCRDFELTNLWQRSVFLTAFLILCFTGYGSVLMKLLDNITGEFEILITLNTIEYSLSILGIVFSILWIKMGKGSKAWYEVYESAIGAVETNPSYATKKAVKFGGFSYAKLPNYGGVNIDNRITSQNAGEYSVSKINIAIGQVFMILWGIVNIGHIIFMGVILHNEFQTGYIDIFVTTSALFILFIVVLFLSRPQFLKSGALRNFSQSTNSKRLK